MIKFWKSAAKGKSGCPVRPPEQTSSSSSKNLDIKALLDFQGVEEAHADVASVFDKKSKLSLTLHDILTGRKALKYFILFMESIGKDMLVKCWLELDNFKYILLECNPSSEVKIPTNIIRAKSFDLPCKSPRHQQRAVKKSDTGPFSGRSNPTVDSSRSCGNIPEHASPALGCDNSDCLDPTEMAINLFKKYVALEAPQPLDLPDSLRKSIISNICQPEGQITDSCFRPVQDILFSRIENDHYSDFLDSPFYIRAQIDVLTNGSLNLRDILYNESILFYFTEYLEQESCRSLLEFLMAILNFRDNLLHGERPSPEQAQQDAIVIYDRYFSLQATAPLGFPTDIRLKIEMDICADGGTLPTCFDLPFIVVFRTLSKYVEAFIKSEVYYKYLSEMIHSVELMGNNHKTNSDCSSEFSISTQNTLLAMGDPVFRKKRHNRSVPDMTIDSNQLYNADSLWQRKKSEGLSLGRVNSLGRFESKFEPDPDKKGKSVLKKMVSRFVPTNNSKVEEEMAWQIAHMIVKDVTDLTMAPPDEDEGN